MLRVLGCACWPNLRPYNSRKLEFRSKRCAFLGYSTYHKGFKCLDVAIGRIYISRDVVLDESIFLFADLHPNAGMCFHSALFLLPTHLRNLPGGSTVHDPVVRSHIIATNQSFVSVENSMQTMHVTWPVMRRILMHQLWTLHHATHPRDRLRYLPVRRRQKPHNHLRLVRAERGTSQRT
jgi:hypothetical protein